MTKKRRFNSPAMLVTAAFIGPGTILTASRAGAEYGFSLLWAVVFATLTAIVLQEMAGRLGIATGSGLAQAIRRAFGHPVLRWTLTGLVLLAILAGNTAFQAGNLIGANVGAEIIVRIASQDSEEIATREFSSVDSQNQVPSLFRKPVGWVEVGSVILIGLIAWGVILAGRFDRLQAVLSSLVILMSVVFLLSAGLSRPPVLAILAGLVPQLPEGSGWLAIALIGTTVVPYNLFLHSSATANRWPMALVRRTPDREQAVLKSRRDTVCAVSVGGVITASVMVTAAMAFHVPEQGFEARLLPHPLDSVGDVANQLQPVLGQWATLFFGFGILAAGFTSAVTAPIAAGLVAAGCFGWSHQIFDWRVKGIASGILGIGLTFAIYFRGSPQQAILFAQFANGLLLPFLALILLFILNQPKVVNRFINRSFQNVLGTIVLLVVIGIAIRQLWLVYERL